jgi:hypothetical protein
MSKTKIIVSALILGLGTIGAYLIVSIPTVAETPSTSQSVSGNNPVGMEIVSTSTTKNLSEILTKKLEDSISKENSQILKTSDGKTMLQAPTPEKMTEDLIAEAQKNFDPNSLRPKITDSSLKISEDNSGEAISKYFESFNQIMVSAIQEMPASINEPEKLTVPDFLKIKQTYEGAVNKFYNLSVPRLALDIHKKEIELLSAKKNIYEKVANMDQDPLTAMLSAQELLKIDSEFVKLKADTENFIKNIFK